MTEPRKASDILLALETEIRSLKGIVNLQDSILKMILGNCNKTNAILEALIDVQQMPTELRASIKSKFFTPEQPSEAIAIDPGFPIEVEREFKGQRRINRPANAPSTKASNADIEFKDYMASRKKSAPEEFKPKVAEPVKSEKKVPVSQRVQDNSNKDLFMAEINLFSSDGSPVLKTRTNPMGKWQAQLPPGKYTVKVSKMDTALQKKIEGEQNITVGNSNSTIILPTLIVNRE
jgi:hypothetical protein